MLILQLLSEGSSSFHALRETWLSTEETAATAVPLVVFISSLGLTVLDLEVENMSLVLLIAAFRQFSNAPSFLKTAHLGSLSSDYITHESSLLLSQPPSHPMVITLDFVSINNSILSLVPAACILLSDITSYHFILFCLYSVPQFFHTIGATKPFILPSFQCFSSLQRPYFHPFPV